MVQRFNRITWYYHYLARLPIYITIRETREDRKHRLSLIGRNAVNKRWSDYHATCSANGYDRIYDRPENMYEITFKNLMTNEYHVLLLHPGPRVDNFRIDVDGKFWRVGGWTKTVDRFRKSCNRI